jgi:hypothetical protein
MRASSEGDRDDVGRRCGRTRVPREGDEARVHTREKRKKRNTLDQMLTVMIIDNDTFLDERG